MTQPMVQEREVWDAAVFLIAKHGLQAAAPARLNVGLLEGEHEPTARAWRVIAKAAAEIVRLHPALGESTH